MSGGTVVPRHERPGGHFFQGDSHASDTGTVNDPIVDLVVLATVLPRPNSGETFLAEPKPFILTNWRFAIGESLKII